MALHHLNDGDVLFGSWGLICLTLLIILALKFFFRPNFVSPRYVYPPWSPFGFITVVKEMSCLRFHNLLISSAKEVGPVFRLNNGKTMVAVGDADVARKILNDNSSGKPDMYKSFRLLHGQKNDIFTSDGGLYWKHSRKGMSSAFSSNHIRIMNKVTQEQTENFIKNKLNNLADTGQDFDISEEAINLTLNIICEAAFQYHICQDEKDEFLTEIDIVLKEVSKNKIPFRWRFGSLIPSYRRALLGQKRLLSLAFRIIDSYHQLDFPVKGTIIDSIINNESYKSDKERAADVVMLLIAGYDTTAYSLAWTLLELAKNPEEQMTLHTELKDADFEERGKLDMLNYVIKEGLRLHPVAALGSGRIVSKDIVIKRKDPEPDILIPKGMTVLTVSIIRHRNEEYYEDPDTFKPSRWRDPSDKAVAAFFPFALGKRNCAGQSLANAELHTVLAHLCAEFQFVVKNEGTSEYFLTLKPKGVRLIAKRLQCPKRN